MPLSQLKRVVVRFSHLSSESKVGRDLLFRYSSPKAVASNKDCVVEVNRSQNGPAEIEVEFTSGAVSTISLSGKSGVEVMRTIQSQSRQLDNLQKLTTAGLNKTLLGSSWHT